MKNIITMKMIKEIRILLTNLYIYIVLNLLMSVMMK